MIARFRRACLGWTEDGAAQMGAALAYYTLFSLTPLLILTLATMSMLYSEKESREELLRWIERFAHPESATAVDAMIDGFQQSRTNVGLSLVGLGSLLFGATGMFISLRSSLHRIWRLNDTSRGVVGALAKTYLVALLMILVSCAFVIVLLLVSAVLPILAHYWRERIPTIPWSGPLALFALSTLSLMLLFLFTYRFLSDGLVPYRRLWSGAFVSATLFSAGKVAIGQYFAFANLGSIYGAAGSVVMFLAWVYYSSQIFFFGAEVIRAGLPNVAPQEA